MNYKIWLKIFFLFLKKENIKIKFCFNMENKDRLESIYRDRNPSYFISHAFIWTRTKEGHDFWKDKDKKWKIIIKKVKYYTKKYGWNR